MSKKKRKKQRYIAKIISDGKISQKEAKKAVKKGISLGRIQNAQTKSFIPDNVYSNARLSRESSRQAPTQFDADVTLPRRYSNNIAKSYQQEHGGLGTYSPLKMKGKVRSIFDTPAQTAAATDTAATDTAATDTSQTDTKVEPEVDPLRGDLDAALAKISDLEGQLNKRPEMPDFGALFKGLADREAAAREQNLIAQREAQEQQAAYMEEMAARQMAMDRQRKLDFQTSQANTARAGMLPNFMIGGMRAGMYGTSGFKRRRRFMPATIAQGIMAGGAAAVNALNV
jgi:hypothetical protein